MDSYYECRNRHCRRFITSGLYCDKHQNTSGKDGNMGAPIKNQRNLYRIVYTMPKNGVWGHPIEVEAGMAWLIPVESTKLERKLRDALNRICKLVPSVRRISELDRIAVELEAEADTRRHHGREPHFNPDGLDADVLILRRFEYDLTSMREAKASIAPTQKQRGSNQEAPMRAGSKYEPTQWPRGERP